MKPIKRRSLAIGFVAACIVFAALPSTAAAQPGPGTATGTGTVPHQIPALPDEAFAFTATGTPTAATGTMTFETFPAVYQATVACMGVTGNQARIVGRLTAPPGAVGTLLIFDVQDNGMPGAGLDLFNGSFLGIVGADPFPLCLQAPSFGRLLRTGEIVVTPLDAACPPNNDEDNDGSTDHNENLLLTLLGNPDSDLDGIKDGNDDANGNGEADEDEDDDDGCPDEDSDDDGEDDEDEDDD